MPVEFETKKVPMETLGEYLTAVRRHLDLPLEEVTKRTGIYEKFIHYLETGKYHQLPPDVYVLGFLKKLAEVYSVPCALLLEQYRKERGIVEQVAREKIAPTKGWRAKLKGLTITPKLITLVGSITVACAALLYIVGQVFAINRTPPLEIFEPQSDSVVQGTTITVSGKTEPGMVVTINDQNVYVNTDGTFRTALGVAPGQKELRVQAENKFGKISTKVVSMRIEEPTVAGATTTTEPTEQLKLELKFIRATKIMVNRDGIEIPEEIVPLNGIKTITAKDTIVLTTPDAGSIQATLNDKPLGILGRKDEQLTIPFTKDATLMVTTPATIQKNSNVNH